MEFALDRINGVRKAIEAGLLKICVTHQDGPVPPERLTEKRKILRVTGS